MNNSKTGQGKARLFEVDAAKFFAIVFMVLIHIYERLGSFDLDHRLPDSFYRNLIEFLGGPMAAPLFMFCMGVGMIYTSHGSWSDFVRRGVKLLIMGYVLNFFRQTLPMLIASMMGIDTGFSLIGGLLNVDILPFAGMTFITIGLLKKLRVPTKGILVISVLLQAAGIWATKLKIASVGLATFVGLLLPSGDHVAFPMTLWLIYPVSGMLFGEVIKSAKDRSSLYRKLLLISSVFFVSYTVAMIFIGYDIRLFYSIYELSYYHQTILSFMWILPLVIIFLGSCFFLFMNLEKKVIGRFMSFCSINLTAIYVIQWLLIALACAFAVLLGFENTSSAFYLTLIAVVILSLAIVIANIYRRIKNRIVGSGNRNR